MNAPDTGGPAFPVPASTYGANGDLLFVSDDGMTLRDYFAAKAMSAAWSDIPNDANRDQALRAMAINAYEMADAMLAERAK